MFINIPSSASPRWRDPVATSSELPSTGQEGDIRFVINDEELVYWDGSAWQTITGSSGGGITSLNGISTSSQTFAVGTSGTDFNISSAGSVHTFNIPDASDTARGAVTTGSQTFGGAKTFADDVEVQGTFTASGSVSGIDEYKPEIFILGASEISAKEVTLSETPTTANLTRVIPISGVEQEYGTDFTVSGNTLSWNALGLDGVLADGDKIIVIYN